MANVITSVTNVISDVKRFQAFTQAEHNRLSKLRAAGLIAQNELYNQRADAPGQITAIPFLNALDGNSVPGTDDGTEIESYGITGDELLVPRLLRNAAWAGSRLSALVSGADVMGSIVGGIGGWRAREEERICMLMAKGVYADALANDSAAMVVGAGTTKLDSAMIIDAAQTKGERKDALNTVVIHSAVHAQWQKDNLIQYIPATDQMGAFERFGKYRIVVSDSMPVDTGVYTSMLCGDAVFAVGDGTPARGPIALVSNELAGTGTGVDTLVARRQFLAGVAGYSWTGSGNPNDDALDDAANYVRKVDTDLLPFVFIRSDLS